MIPPSRYKNVLLMTKTKSGCLFRLQGGGEFAVPRAEIWSPPPESMVVGQQYDIEVDGWWEYRNRVTLPVDGSMR